MVPQAVVAVTNSQASPLRDEPPEAVVQPFEPAAEYAAKILFQIALQMPQPCWDRLGHSPGEVVYDFGIHGFTPACGSSRRRFPAPG